MASKPKRRRTEAEQAHDRLAVAESRLAVVDDRLAREIGRFDLAQAKHCKAIAHLNAVRAGAQLRVDADRAAAAVFDGPNHDAAAAGEDAPEIC